MRNLIKISWTKSIIFILLILSIIIGSGYIYFRFSSDSTFKSENTIPSYLQEAIDSAVSRTAIIAGMQVVKINLQRNVRYIAYSSIKDSEVKKLYSNFISDNISLQIPAFSANKIQNSIMVAAINHEFICYPFTDTVGYEMVPEMAKYINTVCSISVPVETGKFVGIVVVFLYREPTPTERDLIRIESIAISQKAYEAIK